MIEYKFHIGQKVCFLIGNTIHKGIIKTFIFNNDKLYNVYILPYKDSKEEKYIELSDDDIIGY